MKPLLTILAFAVTLGALRAQELPRPSLAREESGTKSLPTDYNMKLGPVLFNVNASLETDYNDNIGLSHNNQLSDLTLTPELGFGVRWPVTETNTLELSTSLGYTKYLFHPKFDTSTVLVAPDSKFSFDIYSGNFKINIHDEFSSQQDPVNEAALTNVVNFNRFQNIAGLSVLWDLNHLVLNLNYDHINFLSTGLQTSSGANVPDPGSLDFQADQVSGSAEIHFTSTLNGGLEAAASTRTYDQESGEYDQLSAGPYMSLQITDHLKSTLAGGYQYISTPGGSSSPLPQGITGTGILTPQRDQGSTGSYYVDFGLDNQINSYYFHRLSAGHDINLGLLGDETQSTYVNYTGSWHVNSHINLAFNLDYQDVTEDGGYVNVSPYDVFAVGAQASFPVTRSISGSLLYQFQDRMSNDSIENYTQNRVGLILAYHF